MLHIRPFERSQNRYEQVVQLHNAVWPDRPATVAEWVHFEKTADPACLYRELTAYAGDELVGYLFFCEPWWWERTPGMFFMEALVHPKRQRQGIGRALYDAMLEELSPRPIKLLHAKSREDQANGVGFLKRLGFSQTMRYPRSQLALEAFDPSTFDGLYRKLDQQGVRIRTLLQLQASDPDWKHKLYELIWQIDQDVPSSGQRRKPTLEEFERRFLDNPRREPRANFIATDGEQYVGFSNLWPNEDASKLNTGLSGVVRGHRRRGICTALKVRGFQFAKASGAKVIETENEENNPMYQLNLQLGFQPKPAWLDFKRTFEERGHP